MDVSLHSLLVYPNGVDRTKPASQPTLGLASEHWYSHVTKLFSLVQAPAAYITFSSGGAMEKYFHYNSLKPEPIKTKLRI